MMFLRVPYTHGTLTLSIDSTYPDIQGKGLGKGAGQVCSAEQVELRVIDWSKGSSTGLGGPRRGRSARRMVRVKQKEALIPV